MIFDAIQTAMLRYRFSFFSLSFQYVLFFELDISAYCVIPKDPSHKKNKPRYIKTDDIRGL